MKQKRDKDTAQKNPPQADLIAGITQDALKNITYVSLSNTFKT